MSNQRNLEGSLRAARATNQLTTAYLSFFSLLHSLVLSQFPHTIASIYLTLSSASTDFILPIPILSLYLFLSLPLLYFSVLFLPFYPFDVLSKFSTFLSFLHSLFFSLFHFHHFISPPYLPSTLFRRPIRCFFVSSLFLSS